MIYSIAHISKKTIVVFTLFLCIFIVWAHSSPLFAQSIEINPSIGVEDTFNKNIPLDLNIVSNATIADVKVQWIIPGGIDPVGGQNLMYTVPLTQNNVLYDHIVLTPRVAGHFAVSVNLSGVYNGNAFNKNAVVYLTIDQNLNTNENANIYIIKKIIFYLVSAISLTIFIFLLKGVYNYIKILFRSWLNKDS